MTETDWWYHRFTPNAEGTLCLCGLPKEHQSHGEPPPDDTPEDSEGRSDALD